MRINSPEMSICVVYSIFLMVVLVVMFAAAAAAGQNDDEYCRAKRCRDDGPIIRFPFRLKLQQPDHCGYPGFELSCSKLKDTVVEFQYHANTSQEGLQVLFYVKAIVAEINYTSQQVILESSRVLSSRGFTTLYSSAANKPFRFSGGDYNISAAADPPPGSGPSSYVEKLIDNTLFSCSSNSSFRGWQPLELMTLISGGNASQVYAVPSNKLTFDIPVPSCTKINTILSLPPTFFGFGMDYQIINWTTPNCGKCEAKGEYCKMDDQNINSSNSTTTCFRIPEQPPAGVGSGHASNKADVARRAGIIPSVILVALVLVAVLYYLIKSNKRKKEDQLKIEMFLEDYKAMKPTRYSYADIKKITHQFSNKLGQGGYGSVYKGQISSEIPVAVKVLNSGSKGNGEDFINEVGTIGRIHHVNVVRLVGYCADGCNRALVYEFLQNNSLEKFVCSEKNHNNKFLGWEKIQEIALGVAKGIEYLHQGCAQRILHFDIKPHNILLDHDFNPKISDFGMAKLCSKDQSIVSMTVARGTIGYIAPEVFSRNFGNVSSKSDVYSFGMLLLEMVGGKNNSNDAQSTNESYFPEWIFHRLEQGGEVTIQIEKEEDSNIARKLTIVGLWCIGWHPVDRPSMKHVIQMLEREDCPAMPPNPFSSTNSANGANATRTRPFTNELEVISESE